MLFRTPTSDLLTRIPLSAGTIVVVGSASGSLAAAYRRMNPKAQVLEIDVDSVEKNSAAHRTHPNNPTDWAAEAPSFGVPDGVDCIIYTPLTSGSENPQVK